MHGNDVSPLQKPLAGLLISLILLSISSSRRHMHAESKLIRPCKPLPTVQDTSQEDAIVALLAPHQIALASASADTLAASLAPACLPTHVQLHAHCRGLTSHFKWCTATYNLGSCDVLLLQPNL